jgi:hypothetical protein
MLSERLTVALPKIQDRYSFIFRCAVLKRNLLKLDVGAEGGDQDGAAIAVVAGVIDVLEAGG